MPVPALVAALRQVLEPEARLGEEVVHRSRRVLGQFLAGREARRSGLGPLERDLAPERVVVDTCNFDHPKALALYQRAGFVPARQAVEVKLDPRPLG